MCHPHSNLVDLQNSKAKGTKHVLLAVAQSRRPHDSFKIRQLVGLIRTDTVQKCYCATLWHPWKICVPWVLTIGDMSTARSPKLFFYQKIIGNLCIVVKDFTWSRVVHSSTLLLLSLLYKLFVRSCCLPKRPLKILALREDHSCIHSSSKLWSEWILSIWFEEAKGASLLWLILLCACQWLSILPLSGNQFPIWPFSVLIIHLVHY